MGKPNAIGWFDLYVNDIERAATFYEAVFQKRLEPIGDPTGETTMRSFPADMGAYGAAGALVKSPTPARDLAARWSISVSMTAKLNKHA